VEADAVIANLGYLAQVLCLALALFGASAALYGAVRRESRWVESARRAMLLTWPIMTLAIIAILLLLTGDHFEIRYVQSVVSRSMPTYLKVTALWAGQAGSLLFWSWLLAAFASAAGLRRWDRDREFLPWVIVVTMLTLAFFAVLTIFYENPFARLWQFADGSQSAGMFQPAGALPLLPYDGQGLNPLLRHPGMIIHPPALYLGFVAFVIPFAFAMAALITGRTDNRWIRITRGWSLAGWLFLSLGLILGGRWAYDVLGWGGYWGWDPVEVAALLPWLTSTAFLHSVIVQEKRGMLKQWNVILIILTYVLVILGTFLTRSGVLTSVHSFGASPINPLFLAFLGITAAIALWLLIRRWNDLRGENQLDSMISREALFLFNNLLFIAILLVCFIGIIYPRISELLTGEAVTFGPPWYERITGPLWLGLLLLMGLATLAAYGHVARKRFGRVVWTLLGISFIVPIILFVRGIRLAGALLGYWFIAFVILVTLYEFWRGALARRQRHGEGFLRALWRLVGRNRRRYGGYLVHLGLALMAMGIFAMEMYQKETQGSLVPGEQITLSGYTMVYEDFTQFDMPDGRNISQAAVAVYHQGKYEGELYPRKDFYYASQQPVTVPAVRTTLEGDLYVLLVGWEPIGIEGATFKVYFNPLVNFIWGGALVLVLGAVVAMWPERSYAMQAARREAVSMAPSEA
jgi:cytochrome c-type biogenesis protein CcmF